MFDLEKELIDILKRESSKDNPLTCVYLGDKLGYDRRTIKQRLDELEKRDSSHIKTIGVRYYYHLEYSEIFDEVNKIVSNLTYDKAAKNRKLILLSKKYRSNKKLQELVTYELELLKDSKDDSNKFLKTIMKAINDNKELIFLFRGSDVETTMLPWLISPKGLVICYKLNYRHKTKSKVNINLDDIRSVSIREVTDLRPYLKYETERSYEPKYSFDNMGFVTRDSYRSLFYESYEEDSSFGLVPYKNQWCFEYENNKDLNFEKLREKYGFMFDSSYRDLKNGYIFNTSYRYLINDDKEFTLWFYSHLLVQDDITLDETVASLIALGSILKYNVVYKLIFSSFNFNKVPEFRLNPEFSVLKLYFGELYF